MRSDESTGPGKSIAYKRGWNASLAGRKDNPYLETTLLGKQWKEGWCDAERSELNFAETLVTQWQEDQSEFFRDEICGIVQQYAEWREFGLGTTVNMLMPKLKRECVMAAARSVRIVMYPEEGSSLRQDTGADQDIREDAIYQELNKEIHQAVDHVFSCHSKANHLEQPNSVQPPNTFEAAKPIEEATEMLAALIAAYDLIDEVISGEDPDMAIAKMTDVIGDAIRNAQGSSK